MSATTNTPPGNPTVSVEEISDAQTAHRCCGCNCSVMAYEYERPLCESCRARYPKPLIKAVFDTFDYVMRLTTGELIRFVQAEISGDWVHLTGSGAEGLDSSFPELPHP
jgi:hypothetical protein